MGGCEDCALDLLAGEELEVPQIIGSRGLETIDDRIRLIVLLAHLAFLDQVSSSH